MSQCRRPEPSAALAARRRLEPWRSRRGRSPRANWAAALPAQMDSPAPCWRPTETPSPGAWRSQPAQRVPACVPPASGNTRHRPARRTAQPRASATGRRPQAHPWSSRRASSPAPAPPGPRPLRTAPARSLAAGRRSRRMRWLAPSPSDAGLPLKRSFSWTNHSVLVYRRQVAT